jgi:hypothetical protein
MITSRVPAYSCIAPTRRRAAGMVLHLQGEGMR